MEDREFDSEEISCVGDVRVLRVALKSESDANKWVATFAESTRTEWVKLRTYPDPTRYVFRGSWCCAFSSKNKRAPSKRNLACPAKMDMKIKLNTEGTRKNDCYLRGDNPKAAIVRFERPHNHDIECAETSKMMRGKSELRDTFYQYFQRGMSPAQAMKLHEQKIMVEERGTELLADAHFNPTKRSVYYWHCLWRKSFKATSNPSNGETLGSFWENFMSKENQKAPTDQPADVADAGTGPAPSSPAPSHTAPEEEEEEEEEELEELSAEIDVAEGREEMSEEAKEHLQGVIDQVAAGKWSRTKDNVKCREKANALFTEIMAKWKSLHQAEQSSPTYVRHLGRIKRILSSIKDGKDYMKMLARMKLPKKTTTRHRTSRRRRFRTKIATTGIGQRKRRRIIPLVSDSEDE